MNLSPLRTHLVAQHHHQPQSVRMIEHSIRELEEALGRLAALGHLYHLAPGPMPQMASWPRLMFHVDAAPNGRVVVSEWELGDLGGEAAGWYPTLDAAQHAEGVKTQFAGRGGVGVRNLPVALDASHFPQPDRENISIYNARVNAQRIEQWKKENLNGHE